MRLFEPLLPLRDKDWLAAVGSLKLCALCGANGEQVAHYSGRYAHVLGRGRGVKASDHATCKLCKSCHDWLDSYAGGNDDERTIMFLLAILRSQQYLILGEQISARKSRQSA